MDDRTISREPTPLEYTPLERILIVRPIDRIQYIVRQCTGLRVLDLGAMDETAFLAKRGKGLWLHEEIAKRAARVDGIDGSVLVPKEGLTTGPDSMIHHGDIMDLDPILGALRDVPEIIVAGELIEHLDNPLQFLKSVAANSKLKGKILIVSTPNATALHNCLIGLGARESTHHDHLCLFSYKTLNTLCTRAGFESWIVLPYFARFSEMRERNSGLVRLFVTLGERTINMLEWIFPMMAFGYVVKIRI
ncbi:MAG: class I SAM-dependent methyltransferase [Burkholderiaceae bacterium]|jgi:hypothetical protein